MPLSPSSRRRRGCVHKPTRKVCVSRIKVLQVLQSVMAAATTTAAATSSTSASSSSTAAADVAAIDSTNDFYSTGRVGRRNALPDILSQQHARISTADLPDALGALSTRDPATGGDGEAACSSSGSADAAAAASGKS